MTRSENASRPLVLVYRDLCIRLYVIFIALEIMESELTFYDDNFCKFHVLYAFTRDACALETRRRFVTERAISFPEAAILFVSDGDRDLWPGSTPEVCDSRTSRMLRVKSDKSDLFWSRSIVFTKPFKTRMSLDLARGPDFPSACQKGPLGTRLLNAEKKRESRNFNPGLIAWVMRDHSGRVRTGKRI